MKGIPVQSSNYHPDYTDGVREAFLVKVRDEWFRIEHSSDAVSASDEENQRPQLRGVEHHIEMVRCGPPRIWASRWGATICRVSSQNWLLQSWALCPWQRCPSSTFFSWGMATRKAGSTLSRFERRDDNCGYGTRGKHTTCQQNCVKRISKRLILYCRKVCTLPDEL